VGKYSWSSTQRKDNMLGFSNVGKTFKVGIAFDYLRYAREISLKENSFRKTKEDALWRLRYGDSISPWVK
jgi:hypothetical protein